MEYLRNLPDNRYNHFNLYAKNHTLTNYFYADYSQRPGYNDLFFFEKLLKTQVDAINNFFLHRWHYSIYLSLIYVCVIFGLKYVMSFRDKGFDLRRELIAWNTFLSLFSLCGILRTAPEFIDVVWNRGFRYSYTTAGYCRDERVLGWYILFIFSKAPELIDTLFIVLRKRKLIPLHWIHHVLTLCFSWSTMMDVHGPARWFINMNLMIHTFMYAYFALAASRLVRIPKFVNITLTMAQITQMIIGFYITYDVLQIKLRGGRVDSSLITAITGFALYFLFFCMFVNFFVKTYLLPKTLSSIKNMGAKKAQ